MQQLKKTTDSPRIGQVRAALKIITAPNDYAGQTGILTLA